MVLGANHLQNRYKNRLADEKCVEAMKLLYKEYIEQEDKVNIYNIVIQQTGAFLQEGKALFL